MNPSVAILSEEWTQLRVTHSGRNRAESSHRVWGGRILSRDDTPVMCHLVVFNNEKGLSSRSEEFAITANTRPSIEFIEMKNHPVFTRGVTDHNFRMGMNISFCRPNRNRIFSISGIVLSSFFISSFVSRFNIFNLIFSRCVKNLS